MKIKKGKSISRLYFRRIYLSAVFSLLIFLMLQICPREGARAQITSQALQSSIKMMEAIREIRKYFLLNNIPFNTKLDPNRTGLIGDANSKLTTTLGNLPAKRTTTNPNFSGLIADLILETGVKPDQTIVINSSASFPALMIAALCAAETLNITPLLHLSIGSSSYGANNPDFNILKMLTLLNEKNIIKTRPVSISIGGDQDIGLEIPEKVKNKILQEINQPDQLLGDCQSSTSYQTDQ